MTPLSRLLAEGQGELPGAQGDPCIVGLKHALKREHRTFNAELRTSNAVVAALRQYINRQNTALDVGRSTFGVGRLLPFRRIGFFTCDRPSPGAGSPVDLPRMPVPSPMPILRSKKHRLSQSPQRMDENGMRGEDLGDLGGFARSNPCDCIPAIASRRVQSSH